MGVKLLASGYYTARVRHHDSPGLRVSIGHFSTEKEAHEAVERYARTGKLPYLGRPRYRGVHQARAGWFYEFEGDIFGPFCSEVKAAWHRRRDRDNVTQRARRARKVRPYGRVASDVFDAVRVLSNVNIHAMTTRQGALATNDARISEDKNDIDAPISIVPSHFECTEQDENLLIDGDLTFARTGGGEW
jgi:hypothetical protein